MSELKIASWNLGRGLSDEERVPQIVEGIKQINADIIFLPEAVDKTGDFATDDLDDDLLAMGYDLRELIEYDDAIEHPSGRQFLYALGKSATQAALRPLKLETRNAMGVVFEDSDFRAIGVHNHDVSGAHRKPIIQAAIDHDPDMVIGDLNNIPPGTFQAAMLSNGIAATVAKKVPHERVRSLGTRLVDMAGGESYTMLEEAGYVDVGPAAQATMCLGRVALFSLDHAMVKSERYRDGQFKVHKTKGSDHRAISYSFSKNS